MKKIFGISVFLLLAACTRPSDLYFPSDEKSGTNGPSSSGQGQSIVDPSGFTVTARKLNQVDNVAELFKTENTALAVLVKDENGFDNIFLFDQDHYALHSGSSPQGLTYDFRLRNGFSISTDQTLNDVVFTGLVPSLTPIHPQKISPNISVSLISSAFHTTAVFWVSTNAPSPQFSFVSASEAVLDQVKQAVTQASKLDD